LPLNEWTIARLVVSDHDGRRHNSEMEPEEKTASPHQLRRTATSGPQEDHSRSRRSNGWAECREKNIGIEPMEDTFRLTFLLIGHCYMPSPHVIHIALPSGEAQPPQLSNCWRSTVTKRFGCSLFGSRSFQRTAGLQVAALSDVLRTGGRASSGTRSMRCPRN
jgi:hypothetical protein